MTTAASPRVNDLLIEQVADAVALIAPRAAAAEELLEAGTPAAPRAVAALAESALEALEGLRVLLPLVCDGGAPPFAPVPGLAEVRLEAARRAGDEQLRMWIDPALGRVAAGVQLVLHHATCACLELHDASEGATILRLRRLPAAVELAAAFEQPPALPERRFEAVRRRAALYDGLAGWNRRRLLVRVPVQKACAGSAGASG